MKKMRTFKRIIIILFLLLVICISVALSYLGSIGRVAVEKVGTSALSVPVTLEDLDISALRGKVFLEGLDIGNPEGFKTERLFRLGNCSTDVAMKTLFDDTIVVNDITISGLEVTFEQKGMTSNLQALLDLLAKNSEKQTEKPKDKPKDKPESDPKEKTASGKNLRIDRFHIKEAKVHLKLLPLPGNKSDITVKMAPFTLEHVSSDQDKGQLAGTVIRKLFVAISQAVIKTIAQDIPAELLKGLQGSLQGAVKIIGSGADILIKSVGAIGNQGIKTIGAAVDGAGKVLEGAGKGAGKTLEGIGSGAGKTLEGIGSGAGKVLEGAGKGIEGVGKGIGGLLGGNKKEEAKTEPAKETKKEVKKEPKKESIKNIDEPEDHMN